MVVKKNDVSAGCKNRLLPADSAGFVQKSEKCVAWSVPYAQIPLIPYLWALIF